MDKEEVLKDLTGTTDLLNRTRMKTGSNTPSERVTTEERVAGST